MTSLVFPEDSWISQQIIASHPLSMILVDALQPDLPIIYVNPAFQRITGYSWEEAVGQNCRFLHGPDRHQPGLDVIRAALKQKTGCQVSMRNYRKDGSMFWNEIRISPIYNRDGVLTHYIGVQSDITQRKQAEDALRRSEERFRAISELISDYAYSIEVDAAGNMRTMWTVGAFTAITGYTIGELEARGGWGSLLYPDDLTVAAERFARLSAGEDDISEFRILTASGELRWLRDYGHPVWDESQGRVTQIFGAAQDVTEHKQMESALRQSELQYRLLVENSQNAISLHTPDGRFIYANPAHIDTYGYPLEELRAMSPDELIKLVHPDDLDLTRNDAHVQAVNGHVITHLEYRARRKDGTVFWIEAFATPIRDQDGNVTRVLSSQRDITERKQAQERDMQIKLEKERMRVLSTFIQNASHEFRTPLAIINSSAYLMAKAESFEKRQQKAEQIEQQILRTTRLVDMLMKMVVLEDMMPTTTWITISSLLQFALTEVETIHPELQVHVEVEPGLPRITGYAEHLYEAVQQLIDNACRYSGPQGSLWLRAYRQESAVVLEVEDNGVGIAPEDQPFIFETFWRRHKDYSTPGFGLGLPIVKRVVELHGGNITVISEEGRGSLFRITLPVDHYRTSAHS
ncbi:MAG: hypothetical protein OHK0046_19020 [Anaerolineae bacterium]